MALDPVAPYRGVTPQLATGAWVHPRATVIGEVSLGRDASVWPGAVIRGDVNSIAIGEASNIQDNSVLHVSHKTPDNPAGGPLVIGARVTVGHTVILHACTIEDECLVGMGSIILNGARVGTGSVIAAGALVPEKMQVPAGSLVMGVPGRIVRSVDAALAERIAGTWVRYVAHAKRHRNGEWPIASSQ